VDLLRATAPAAFRCPGVPEDSLRARGAADEAGRRQPPQALQAEGPGGQRRLLPRAGLPRRGGALLPARARQRAARGAAAAGGARRAAAAAGVRRRRAAARHGQAGRAPTTSRRCQAR
jgi:hypothetical protein